ncbi:hypothetical protein [Prescottella equi]
MSKEQEERAEEHARMHELVDEVRAVGLRRPKGGWTRPAEELISMLWEYAVPTIQAMLHDGSIQTKGPRHLKFMHVDDRSLEWLRVDAETRHWIASSLVIKVYEKFMEKAVIGGGWDRAKSTLGTYFVNTCLLEKHTVINKWAKENRHTRAEWVEDQKTAFYAEDVAKAAPLRIELPRLIARADPKVRPILTSLALGDRVPDIAREMRMSQSAVWGQIIRFRQRVIIPRVAHGLLDAPSNYFVTNHVAQAIAENDGMPW